MTKTKLVGWIATLALVALAVLSLPSCDGGGASESILNRSVGAEPESLDVHAARSVNAAIVLRDIGEGLTGYTAGGELIAAAAESWQVSEDGLEYRFALRPEARWSNGEPVLAEHFVYSFRRLVNPETAAFYANFLGDVVNANAITAGDMPPDSLGVEAAGPLELVVRLEQPVPYFLSLLTHNSTFPVHPASIDEHGASFARAGNLVSNGPYKLDSWDIGALITLSRNEHYWNNDNTAIDVVRHHVLPEPGAELNRYRAGEIHITETVPTESFAQIREERPDELRIAPVINVYYYGLNLTKPPFKDNRPLREALSMAIDRETITEVVTGRGEQPAYSWVPPGVEGYGGMTVGFESMTRDERHATARRLYREAGYSEDNPLQVEIRYNTSDTHRQIALAIQAMWADVLGVETTLINEEFRVLLSNMRAREVTQAFRSSWSGDYNDANAFLSIMESGNQWNLPGYASEEFDSLLARAAAHPDPRQRQLLLEEAERVLLSDHPVIPIYFYVSKHLVSPEVEGWQDNVLDYHYSHHLSLNADD